MDIASLIGLVMVLVGVFFGMVMKGADPMAMFTNVAALLIVVVGALGSVVMSAPMPTTTAALKALMKIFFPGPPPDLAASIAQITTLAEKARREGLLALEEEAKGIEDPFLRKGLQMAVDGTDPAIVKKTLLAEIKAMKDRHKEVVDWHTQVGVLAPAFGILGAVIGLIAVMAKMEDPAAMGHGIGAAFVATFWGVFMANGMFLPWGRKLKILSNMEATQKLLVVEGVVSVQQGSSPRTVADILNTYVPPSQRPEAA